MKSRDRNNLESADKYPKMSPSGLGRHALDGSPAAQQTKPTNGPASAPRKYARADVGRPACRAANWT